MNTVDIKEYGLNSMRRLKFIDLFCGCGGLGLGFRKAGFESVFAADMDPASVRTYERNFGHDVFQGDIADLTTVPVEADVIVGGPPCQGFSPLGRLSPRKEHARMNTLWREYLRILDQVRPKAFVVENVPEFLKSAEFEPLRREISARGYNLTSGVLNAAEFGVPQKRKRGFIIGMLDKQPSLPLPTEERRTVRDAIGDLPLLPDGVNWHVGRTATAQSLERYRCVPPGGNRFDLMKARPDITPRCWLNKPTGSTDVFGRMEWNKPSLTIRTEFYKPEKGCYLHPEADRPITHREAARLQTFPDDFEFLGNKIETARMIGNAVPPRLAYHVALAVKDAISGERDDERSRQKRISG